jgi:hypothetical protein
LRSILALSPGARQRCPCAWTRGACVFYFPREPPHPHSQLAGPRASKPWTGSPRGSAPTSGTAQGLDRRTVICSLQFRACRSMLKLALRVFGCPDKEFVRSS